MKSTRIRQFLVLAGVSAFVAYVTWQENNKRCNERLASQRKHTRSNTKQLVRAARSNEQ